MTCWICSFCAAVSGMEGELREKNFKKSNGDEREYGGLRHVHVVTRDLAHPFQAPIISSLDAEKFPKRVLAAPGALLLLILRLQVLIVYLRYAFSAGPEDASRGC